MEIVIKEINVETGEEIIRDANVEELTFFAKLKADNEAKSAAEAAKAAARQAILDRLGLTADEAALLLGAN